MPETDQTEIPVSRTALWFGLLGGAVAWTLHILLAPVMAEWGCVTPAPSVILGGTWTIYAIAILTLAMLLLASAASIVSYRCWTIMAAHRSNGADLRGYGAFMARAGLLTSGLFLFVIVIQSIPILYFLSGC